MLLSEPTASPTVALAGTITPVSTDTPVPVDTRLPSATFTPTTTAASTGTSAPASALTPELYAGTPGPSDPKILFMAAGGCAAMSVSLSGGGPQPLAAVPPADCGEAEISPDGTRLAYIGLPGKNTIRAAGIDGSGPPVEIRIPDYKGLPRTIWAVKWSPDGNRLALVASGYADGDDGTPIIRDSWGYLYTMAADGGGTLKRIQNTGIEPAFAQAISWSADSRWILTLDDKSPSNDLEVLPFAYRESDSYSACVANADWSMQTAIHYDWSPDSRYISYLFPFKPPDPGLPADSPDEGEYLVIAELKTSNAMGEWWLIPRRSLPLPGAEESRNSWSPDIGARWSPDGASFLLFNDRTMSLVILEKDGSIRNPVVTLAQRPLYADWSPDGKWIIMVEPGPAADSGGILSVVRPDGADLRALANGVGTGSIVWK
jgi:Tol biopolymer transport system component